MAVAGAAGVAVAAVVVTGAVVLLPGDTAGIRATADALRPPGGWSLADERVTPPRRLCLGADPCPSLHRTWQVGGNLTERDLQDVVDASGWGLRVDGSCALRPGRPGRHEVCAATGVVDGYAATLAHDASADHPEIARVRLDLRPVSA